MRTLFIMGIFRSGTSLLSTALNVHNNIIIAWQPYWLFFKACRNKFFKEFGEHNFDSNFPMGIIRFTSNSQRENFRNILDIVSFNAAELKSLLSDIASYLTSEEKDINVGMKPAELVEAFDTIEPGSAGHVLLQLMNKLYGTNGTTADAVVVGIKEVFCEEFIEPILELRTLNPTVLHIIRDPRAIAASRNYGKYMNATGTKYPLFFIIRSWKRTVENYLANKNKTNYMMLRFEDLVDKPEKILRQACNKVNVVFSTELLELANFRDSRGKKWIPNSSFGKLTSFDTASLEKWKEVLSAEEIEIIEYFCQTEMKLLGYTIINNNFNIERINNYKEDTSQIRDWLKKYDFRLTPEETFPR